MVIETRVVRHDEQYGLTQLDCGGVCLWVGQAKQAPGSRMRARVLAREVSIALQPAHDTGINNILPARIAEICDEGPEKVNVRMTIGTANVLLSRITRRSRDRLKLAVGMQVFAQVKSVALM